MPIASGLNPHYDVLVIGGGVHGAALALEATRLDYRVLLVEKRDFCSQTSANSLKVIHGGLRYLQSLDLRRSRESAREQHRLLKRAPHLVQPLPCLMATERSLTRGRLAMSLGLWFYDTLVCHGLPNRSRAGLLSVEEAGRLCSHCLTEHATGAVLWHDAQVRDSERLVLTYLRTAETAGAHIRNYVAATHVERGKPVSVALRDEFSGETIGVTADVVIDSGSFIDPYPSWTRAVNLVVDRDIGRYAFGMRLRGRPSDGRRLYFATPLDGSTIIGTWYFRDRKDSADNLDEAELNQCLSDVDRLLPGFGVTVDDVTRVHLGRLPVEDPSDPLSLLERPVIRPARDDERVVSVTGVKYTSAGPTARKALRVAGLAGAGRTVKELPWYGMTDSPARVESAIAALFAAREEQGVDMAPAVRRLGRQYGSVGGAIAELASRLPGGFEPIPGCDGIRAEIDYCVEHEHCRTAADFLLRRSGIGALGPPPAEVVEYCVTTMARCFDWPASRIRTEKEDLKRELSLPLAGESGAANADLPTNEGEHRT
jgi:glycerol-3-phosphate dehydrogenase